ncbi:hypothetical protein [Desulfonatronovibrio hydrogenovorans]|uniref:hypothetical protein n=1 Tax=Desulfonatronovibrio hydrogenovorans TaxID=53245 RepID=UPI00048E9422|nr:hypothetical protein [Desulfonatronovibrio hydrogenovorans]
MKYIIFEDFSGEPTPIIFPERVSFQEMREQIPYTRVLSAGLVCLDKGKLKCFGHSHELEARSMEADNSIIIRQLNKSTCQE